MDNAGKALLIFFSVSFILGIVGTVYFVIELCKGDDIILESYTDNLIGMKIDGMYVLHDKKKLEMVLMVDGNPVNPGAEWKFDLEHMGKPNTTIIFGGKTFTLTDGIKEDSFEYDYVTRDNTLVRYKKYLDRINTIQTYIDFKEKTEYYKLYIGLCWLPIPVYIIILICHAIYSIYYDPKIVW